ncbi:MAG: TFIIB-type zinc ribbon-containing protein [Haloarculaceae archaeon]
MKVRGERECKDCGTHWSYYDTGSVVCPGCGSIRSVGLDDRAEHTATTASLDLTTVRGLVDEVTLAELAEEVESVSADYVRRVGFIHGGDLLALDDVYLAASELRHVAADLGRSMRVSDAEERYFFALLAGADEGDRPAPAEVPDSLRSARGLAAAAAVDTYGTEMRRYLEDAPDRTVSRLLGTLDEHRKRVAALDGDVTPRTAERLVRVAVDLGRAVAEDDEASLARAQERLEELSVEV